MFHKYCVPLHKKQLTHLTKPDIIKWHQKIGERHGHYQANRVFQLIRSLFRVGDEIGYVETVDNPGTEDRNQAVA